VSQDAMSRRVAATGSAQDGAGAILRRGAALSVSPQRPSFGDHGDRSQCIELSCGAVPLSNVQQRAGQLSSGRTSPFCPLAIGDRGPSWHASGADSMRAMIGPLGRRVTWLSATHRLRFATTTAMAKTAVTTALSPQYQATP